jgi:hypothetical protein
VRTAKDSDEEEEIQPGAWCSSSYEVVVSATKYVRSSMCSVVRSSMMLAVNSPGRTTFPRLSVPSVVPSSTATSLHGN